MQYAIVLGVNFKYQLHCVQTKELRMKTRHVLQIICVVYIIAVSIKPENLSATLEYTITFSSYGNDDVFPQIYNITWPSQQVEQLTFGGRNLAPQWSPNGQLLAYQFFRSGMSEIYIRSNVNLELFNLTNNNRPNGLYDWSPDSQSLVFTSLQDDQGELYLGQISSRQVTRLTSNSYDDFYPDWSPNGEEIVFSSRRNGDADIYTMNVNKLSLFQLTDLPGEEFNPKWSPDGSSILFISVVDGESQLFVLKVDEATIERVNLLNDLSQPHEATWSPDGEYIAFTASRRALSLIFMYELESNRLVELTSGEGGAFSPVWSPDGQYLAFVSECFNSRAIYVIDISNDNQTCLSDTLGLPALEIPSWYPTF
jgi:Tol biopolymer transport system component